MTFSFCCYPHVLVGYLRAIRLSSFVLSKRGKQNSIAFLEDTNNAPREKLLYLKHVQDLSSKLFTDLFNVSRLLSNDPNAERERNRLIKEASGIHSEDNGAINSSNVEEQLRMDDDVGETRASYKNYADRGEEKNEIEHEEYKTKPPMLNAISSGIRSLLLSKKRELEKERNLHRHVQLSLEEKIKKSATFCRSMCTPLMCSIKFVADDGKEDIKPDLIVTPHQAYWKELHNWEIQWIKITHQSMEKLNTVADGDLYTVKELLTFPRTLPSVIKSIAKKRREGTEYFTVIGTYDGNVLVFTQASLRESTKPFVCKLHNEPITALEIIVLNGFASDNNKFNNEYKHMNAKDILIATTSTDGCLKLTWFDKKDVNRRPSIVLKHDIESMKERFIPVFDSTFYIYTVMGKFGSELRKETLGAYEPHEQSITVMNVFRANEYTFILTGSTDGSVSMWPVEMLLTQGRKKYEEKSEDDNDYDTPLLCGPPNLTRKPYSTTTSSSEFSLNATCNPGFSGKQNLTNYSCQCR